jgi:molybdopterin synthase catalytic subunit
MRVQLLPFGVLKDSPIPATLELPQHATVADLLATLRTELSATAGATQLLSRIAISVNAEYAQATQSLQEDDVVGLLPPVSGGSHAARLTREPISASELIAAAKQGSDGAVVVFDGIVRDNTRGRRTLYLDYEAYEEMAERQIDALIAEAMERFAIREATIVHRLGRIAIGETSVLILVSSAHRAAAFDASRWLIDTLKKTVPIWKKEVFVDGAVWADGEPFPAELAAGAAVSEPRL